jgi:hypothetical protein
MSDTQGLEQRQHLFPWLPIVGVLMVLGMVIASTVISLAGS